MTKASDIPTPADRAVLDRVGEVLHKRIRRRQARLRLGWAVAVVAALSIIVIAGTAVSARQNSPARWTASVTSLECFNESNVRDVTLTLNSKNKTEKSVAEQAAALCEAAVFIPGTTDLSAGGFATVVCARGDSTLQIYQGRQPAVDTSCDVRDLRRLAIVSERGMP